MTIILDLDDDPLLSPTAKSSVHPGYMLHKDANHFLGFDLRNPKDVREMFEPDFFHPPLVFATENEARGYYRGERYTPVTCDEAIQLMAAHSGLSSEQAVMERLRIGWLVRFFNDCGNDCYQFIVKGSRRPAIDAITLEASGYKFALYADHNAAIEAMQALQRRHGSWNIDVVSSLSPEISWEHRQKMEFV